MKKRVIIMALLGDAVFAGDFILKSPQLQQGERLNAEQVFFGFGCTGENISPALYWEGTPENTKSFVVTVYDPDASTGKGWWHWITFNIPANIYKLSKNAGDLKSGLAPEGSTQSKTDFGTSGYGGAAPPPGDKPHRYQFTVYALDIENLPLDANASGAMVDFNLTQHVLAESTITVYYSR